LKHGIVATFALVSASLAVIYWAASKPEEEMKLASIEQAVNDLEKSIDNVSAAESEARSKLLKGYSLDCDYIFESLDKIEGDSKVRMKRKELVERNNILSLELDKILGR